MNDILRRKVLSGAAIGGDGGPGADHGWRLAFARAARDGANLLVTVRSLRMTRRSLAELLELPPERALVALLDGPGGGMGMVALSPEVSSALVEMQTIGRLATGTTASRRPTRTDAAMVTPILDRAMVELDGLLAEEADLEWAGGFRYASFLEDARPLGLLLDDQPYRVLTMEIDLGDEARQGQILLALPAEGRGQRPATASAKAVSRPAQSQGTPFAAALSEAVMGADVTLQAVIARITVPLKAVMGLAPDMVIPLPDAALDKIQVEGIDGRPLANARLGQHRGQRALRITPPGGEAGGDASQAAGAGPAMAAGMGGLEPQAGMDFGGDGMLALPGADLGEMPMFDPDAGFLAAG